MTTRSATCPHCGFAAVIRPVTGLDRVIAVLECSSCEQEDLYARHKREYVERVRAKAVIATDSGEFGTRVQ
jgi:transcription elongation factor Elf1